LNWLRKRIHKWHPLEAASLNARIFSQCRHSAYGWFWSYLSVAGDQLSKIYRHFSHTREDVWLSWSQTCLFRLCIPSSRHSGSRSMLPNAGACAREAKCVQIWGWRSKEVVKCKMVARRRRLCSAL
jgi:hypothetical protein